MDETALEIKIENVEKMILEVKEMLNDLTANERIRLEKYAESNTRIIYIEKELEELKNKLNNRADKVVMWISLSITAVLFLITLFSNLNVVS